MRFVHSDDAPKAIGPYSQAVLCDGVLYCSGQIALDPATGKLAGTTAAEQARACLENLAAVLEAGGSALDGVLKTTIFLVDEADFGPVNEVYGEVMGVHHPARSTVIVKALPLGARVEIEAIARPTR